MAVLVFDLAVLFVDDQLGALVLGDLARAVHRVGLAIKQFRRSLRLFTFDRPSIVAGNHMLVAFSAHFDDPCHGVIAARIPMRTSSPKPDNDRSVVRFLDQLRIHDNDARSSKLEPTEQADDTLATPDELRQAIERLTAEDTYRLTKAASYLLYGSEYQNPLELLNEAILRAMNAAIGDRGRAWKKSISFMAFLMMCMRGIANDSAESAIQKRSKHIEDLATETMSGEEVLAAKGHRQPGVEDLAIETEEMNLRQAIAKADLDAIDQFFEGDEKVSWILMGHKDELTAEEIRTMSGMSATEYDTAMRRFRRGLDKIFPGRRTK